MGCVAVGNVIRFHLHRGRVEESYVVTVPPEATADPAAAARSRSIPEASVARLAVYLRMLGELAEQGAETVSSEELAVATGVNSAAS